MNLKRIFMVVTVMPGLYNKFPEKRTDYLRSVPSIKPSPIFDANIFKLREL